MEIKTYIKENEERFLEELFSLIRIPSISAFEANKNDMVLCAKRFRELLLEAGVDRAEVMKTAGNPVVFAEKIIDKNQPTVLVYGHYDVMPIEPAELWKTQPFEPVVSDGKIWARGADDDKGQSFMQLKAFEYLVKNQELKCNVKFILEGEEEIGSPSLDKFLIKNRNLLKADVILVSDTSMIGRETPSLTTGLRGLAYWQIKVRGANRDLHSGHFGGAVANPINELCKIIAQMVDSNGKITIPHFYDDVLEMTATERKNYANIPFNLEAYKKSIDIQDVTGEKGYTTLERNSCRPAFDVCGIWGGYQGEGSKTIIPSVAYAKVSARLVANQNHEKISQLFIDYVKKLAPKSINIEVEPMHGGEAYICPTNHFAYIAAEKGFEKAFGKKPLSVRRGGSIPIIAAFEKILGIKTVLMGFGLEQNAIHSPNENFDLDIFRKGIEAVVEFYRNLNK